MHILGLFVVCIQLMIATLMLYRAVQSLVRDPITQNPFRCRLLYNVLYKTNNQDLGALSPFAGEDELPSHVDFGKSKYGGPFTTEQVEDVKTLLRILVVGSLECVLLGIALSVFMLKVKITNQLISGQQNTRSRGQLVNECYTEILLQQISNFSWVLVIPLYEFVSILYCVTCSSNCSFDVTHNHSQTQFHKAQY